MRYINELREGDNVSEVYLCKVKNIAKTKAGKTYYSMILQDKTGVIDTKIWDLNNGIENFEQMDYIRVELFLQELSSDRPGGNRFIRIDKLDITNIPSVNVADEKGFRARY